MKLKTYICNHHLSFKTYANLFSDKLVEALSALSLLNMLDLENFVRLFDVNVDELSVLEVGN